MGREKWRWFQTDPNDRETLLLRTDSGQGEPLWPMGWVQHIHKAKSGYVARSGLARILAWPFLFKNYSVRDLAEFLEIYGIPARIGTYPAGASDTEKSTLLNAVMSVGHHAAGIMPEGMMLEFKEAASGASDPFQAMIAWCESSQSKAILGGTLTTSAENTGLGSNLGDVHNEVRHNLLISDARQIAGTLTRDLIWPIVALNIPGIDIRRAPRFRFLTDEAEDLKARADRDKVLFDMGYRLTPEKVEEVYGEGYVPVTQETLPPEEPGQAAATAGHHCPHCAQAALSAASEASLPGEAELESLMASLDAQTLDAQGRALLAPIMRLAQDAPDELIGRLAERYPQMDDDALQEMLARILFVAEVWGRLNAQAKD